MVVIFCIIDFGLSLAENRKERGEVKPCENRKERGEVVQLAKLVILLKISKHKLKFIMGEFNFSSLTACFGGLLLQILILFCRFAH